MSEIATSSSESSSSPSSTADIAASVINDIETPEVETTSRESAETTTETPEGDPEDFDAVPAERTDVLGRKRENAIPHSRVKQMIEKRERKVIADVAKAFGITKAEAELKLEDVLSSATEHTGKVSSYEQRLSEVQAVEAVIAADPDRFITMLAHANPAYQKFAAVLQQAANAQAQPAQNDDPMPEPDYDMGNGQMTYSLDGLQKRMEWERRQAKNEALSEVDKRFKPIEDERKQTAERERLRTIHNEAVNAVNAQMEKATKWPGFKDNEEAILKALQADQTISLHDAYMSVVLPKLQGDRTKMREDIIAEINKKPRSSSAPTSPVAAPETSKTKTTADIAREVMAQFQS